MPEQQPGILEWLERLDRRVIYLFVMVSLLVPILMDIALEPAKLPTAEQFYKSVEGLESRDDQIVFLALDWGPSTQAENGPQTEATIEHLMRKHVKFALISVTYLAEPYLINMPQKVADRLAKQSRKAGKNETWVYGKDWVDIGFKPGLGLLLQQIPKTKDVREVFKTDARGQLLKEIPCMQNIKDFNQIPMLAEFTGLVGVFDMWVQFFQREDHRPQFVHGCTSITIPEAFIYLDSGQLSGLLEGVAGAAYYSKLLGYTTKNPNSAMKNMTGLSLAHVIVIVFIVLGNLGLAARVFRRRS